MHLKNFFGKIAEILRKASPEIVILVYAAVIGLNIVCEVTGDEYILNSSSSSAMLIALIVLTVFSLPSAFIRSDSKISEYDRRIIGNCFRSGSRSSLFYKSLTHLLKGNFNDALTGFQDLKEYSLSGEEKAVLDFYFGICYYRMGYPTNAGRYFEDSYNEGINHPDALLMAARNYGAAENYAQSEELYNKLLDMHVAEDIPIYPFLYNEIGRLYLRQSNAEAAEKFFNISICKGLDVPTAKGGLALCCLCAGKTEEAKYRYSKALISSIPDSDGYRHYCSEMAVAFGYSEDFFESIKLDREA
ncbi:MAG: tetratricopeptide repeat protein [Oscillospiraceae bacterium]